LDAAVYFGLDEATLKKQSPFHIGGVAGGIASYESRVNFRIGTPAQGQPIELFDLPVYFIDGKLPFHVAILLGQVDVLKKVVFAQLHQPPKPFFTLRHPKRRTSPLL